MTIHPALQPFINQIVHGDALTFLCNLPSDSIDMILTSPPYDGLRNYGSKSFNYDFFQSLAKQIYRILKNGGVVVWITADATVDGSETGSSFRQALYFMDLGFKLHDTMIFRRKNPIPQIYRKRYTNEFDYMFVLSKGYVKVHNPIYVRCLHAGLKLAGTTYKNYSKTVQTRTKPAKPVKDVKLRGNIWEYVVGKLKEDQEAKWHPAPFPLALARDHIYSWTNPGDIVLDPFCGSGTTCKAALQLGRYFIGIEINPEYVSKAKERVHSSEISLINSQPYIIDVRDERPDTE